MAEKRLERRPFSKHQAHKVSDGNGPSRRDVLRAAAAAGGVLVAAKAAGAQQQKPSEIKIGIATYLSGPASVFGVPGKQAAEMLFDEINQAGGIQGVPVRPIYVDEGPGVEHVVGEYRRLVQSEKVDLLFAAISSADCLACAPLADEMRKTTVLWDCGTQRIFEEQPREYVFRTQAFGTPEILAPTLYLLKIKPDFKSIAVVNQDYAWGRDSWDIMRTALQALKPGLRVSAELFPKFGATDYSTEITRLLALRPDVVVSTSWGGDLDTFIRQSSDRKLFDRATFVLPLAESSLERVGKALPPGHVISARGDHYFLHPRPDDPQALKRFVESYRKRYTSYPIYPCYHMAQAISATQAAYAKAVQAKQGGWPDDTELSAAFRNLEFASPTTKVRIREDHQGIENMLVGKTRQDEKYPFATLTDMMLIPGDLVSTPVGQKSADWLKTLKPDMVQQLPPTVAG